MRLPVEFQIPIAAVIGALLLVLAAEKLHARRCRFVARPAAGPAGFHAAAASAGCRPHPYGHLIPRKKFLPHSLSQAVG